MTTSIATIIATTVVVTAILRLLNYNSVVITFLAFAIPKNGVIFLQVLSWQPYWFLPSFPNKTVVKGGGEFDFLLDLQASQNSNITLRGIAYTVMP